MTPARPRGVLQIVTSASTDLQDYTYYFVPAPWLSVKLLRLLQCYPPPGNRHAATASRLLRGRAPWLLSAAFVSPFLALALVLGPLCGPFVGPFVMLLLHVSVPGGSW